jgi:glyoxylase-like metal-dependent hydrolase (beta-lactamase superfamily II)
MALQIRTVVSLPFEENTYVVWQDGRAHAVVIDPGLEPELILEVLADEGLTVDAILNTHGHGDHIGGNEMLKRRFAAAPLVIGVREAPLLSDPMANLSAVFDMPVVSPPADRLVKEGETVEAAGLNFEVLEIPGHSQGHVVYVLRGSPVRVFGGDVLFRGSVGRTDFPGGSAEQLFDGIRRKLFTLPPDTVVYPGHGPVTTVGQEKRSNPFVAEQPL